MFLLCPRLACLVLIADPVALVLIALSGDPLDLKLPAVRVALMVIAFLLACRGGVAVLLAVVVIVLLAVVFVATQGHYHEQLVFN